MFWRADHRSAALQLNGMALMEWQTIDSAPRDETQIILRKGNRVTAGAWVEWFETQQHYHQSTGVYLGEDVIESGGSWCSWDGGFCEDDEPTHWMPLPEPPTP